MNGLRADTVKLLPVVVTEDASPAKGSMLTKYCLTIPFLSSGSGNLHDNKTEVELSTDAEKLVGDPAGTVRSHTICQLTLYIPCCINLPSSLVLTVITVLGGPSPTVTAKIVQLYV